MSIFNFSSIKKRGFTLIEAMVAISILSLAVTGPLLIAQKGIGSAVYARDQITAYYLAQEAVEYIRNVRDTNRITGAWWLSQFSSCQPYNSGTPSCSTINGTYKIDARYSNFTNDGGTPTNYADDTVNASAIAVCSGTCGTLSFDSSTKLYGYGSGSTWKTTPFTRTITIDNTASNKEALVTVTISWNTNLFSPPRIFTVKEYMFNF